MEDWMDLWFYEKHIPGTGITLNVKDILYHKRSRYQDVASVDTADFGRRMVIDGMVMLTERDEFVYHDMLTHVPLFVHPKAENVLVIGGGDGGTVRELVKHRNIKKITMVEIDRDVIKASLKYLPSLSRSLKNRRVRLIIDDGLKYVRRHRNSFDVIILDSSDPVGPAKGLFSLKFFRDIYKCLKKDGIMVAQTESPFMYEKVIRETYRVLRRVFPVARMYYAPIPTYPSGVWSFAFAGKRYDPVMNFDIKRAVKRGFKTKYYNEDVHRGAFMLPEFMKNLIR